MILWLIRSECISGTRESHGKVASGTVRGISGTYGVTKEKKVMKNSLSLNSIQYSCKEVVPATVGVPPFLFTKKTDPLVCLQDIRKKVLLQQS